MVSTVAGVIVRSDTSLPSWIAFACSIRVRPTYSGNMPRPALYGPPEVSADLPARPSTPNPSVVSLPTSSPASW